MQKINIKEIKKIIAPMHDEDEDPKRFLEDLITLDYIEDDRAIGITKQIISEGADRLSDSQLYVFRD